MSRNTKPSISPITMSEMIAPKCLWSFFRTATASSTVPTATGSYPTRFSRALIVSRISFSSSTTRIFGIVSTCPAIFAISCRPSPYLLSFFFRDPSSITEISAYYTISGGRNQPLIRRKWQQLAEISKIPALRQIPGICHRVICRR